MCIICNDGLESAGYLPKRNYFKVSDILLRKCKTLPSYLGSILVISMGQVNCEGILNCEGMNKEEIELR